MGGAKQAMLEREGDVINTLDRLARAGAVKQCEVHDYWSDNFDSDAVESVLVKLSAEIGKENAASLVEEAMTYAGEECPACEKNAEE